MNLISFFISLTLLFYIVLLAVVLNKNVKTKAYNRYIGFLIFGALWVATGIFETSNLRYNLSLNEWFSKLDFAFAASLAYFIVLFALHYPKENIKVKFFHEVLLSLPIIFDIVLSFSGKIFHFSTLEPTYNFLWYYVYFVIVVFYLLFLSLFLFIKKLRNSTGLENLRLRYITFSYAVTASLGIFFSVFFAYNTFIGFYFGLANIGTLFFACTTFYVLFRYRLFDIGIVIKRSAIRVISFAIIFGGYLFLVLSLKDSINLSSQSEQTTFLVIATLVVVATIEPIRKLVHRIVDKAFESNEQKREEAQKKIRLTLRSQQTVENLFISMSKIMQDLFNSEKSLFIEKSDSFFRNNKETFQFIKTTGKILIPEELPYRFEEEERYFFIHQELEKTDYSALIPLGQDDIFMGCIVLGKRKNHDAYTVEEVREMKQLQEQFAEALWNARLYQQAIARIKI